MSVNRDTLAISKELESKGFTPSQAEGIAKIFAQAIENDFRDLVTRDYLKAEIAEVRTEIAEVRTELKADISEVRVELKADISEVRTEIAEVRTELKADISESRTEFKAEIRDLKIDMVKWMVGLLFTALGLTFGFIYFLMRH